MTIFGEPYPLTLFEANRKTNMYSECYALDWPGIIRGIFSQDVQMTKKSAKRSGEVNSTG